MNETRELARLVAGLCYDDLPRDVVEVAKDRILDQFGAQLIGSIQTWSKVIYRFATDLGGKPESTVVGYGATLNVLDTAFVNGCFGHAFEIDDTYRGAGHLGCTLVAPSVALGEREHSSGKDLITAVVAAYEAGGRVGRAAGMSVMSRGFHRTATWGHYCAAAGAGKLLGFDAEQMRNAFSITAGDTGGVMQFLRSGDSAVKRLSGGKPAYAGLRAALLAQRGMSGPADAIEGESGVLRAFSDQSDPTELVRDFGRDWVITNVAYKHHCCCSLMQAQADAAIILKNKHQFCTDDVEDIRVDTLARGSYMGSAIPEPATVGDAQFSTPFIVALALIRGNAGYRDFCPENLADPAIRQLAKKVTVHPDPELEATAIDGAQPARVTVMLRDGRRLSEFLDDYVGTPTHPMSRDQVQDKFRDLASAVLARDKVERVIGLVESLEKAWDVSILLPLLVS